MILEIGDQAERQFIKGSSLRLTLVVILGADDEKA